ncbi:phosphoribosyltransferase [Confluentibacter citreus]|uniref:phosphoribosyltransferase n=1 Tax=Confluentibacter citreus TaxID=2007307 RepID=UPI000C29585A|nr:phosphoribosyltransferase family protein [Confluentibacter citreus]
MRVITLNTKDFKQKCSELVSQIDFYPDIIIGVQNGGTFVLNEFRDVEKFDSSYFEVVKIQRKDNFKNNFFAKILLKYMPLKIADRLRVYEHNQIKDGLKDISKEQLLKQVIDCNISLNKPVKKILLVDDAIDTGTTMFIVKNNMIGIFDDCQIKTAVISWTIEESIVKPDFYIFKDVLVRFPWSKDFKE